MYKITIFIHELVFKLLEFCAELEPSRTIIEIYGFK